MSILSSLGRMATELSAARARYRTERALYSLPFEIQKDIGWPEAEGTGPRSRSPDAGRRARAGVGTWAGAK